MKKKIFLSFFVFVALFTITGCGGKKGNEVPVKDAEEIKDDDKDVTNEISRANIKETVLLDKDDIKITAKSISYDSWLGTEIKLLIENNTQKNIIVQADNFSVNGIMIDPLFSANVAAGKKANDEITISDDDLEIANITTIKDIEFDFRIINDDDWTDSRDEKGIKLETDATGYVQKYNTDGKLVVDQNDIKIYVLKKAEEDSFWGAEIYVYIENNSSKNIMVQSRDVSVNGFMMTPAFSSTITAGKKAYDTITFFESDLKDNDITDIKELELKFTVMDADSWKEIIKTDTLKISF